LQGDVLSRKCDSCGKHVTPSGTCKNCKQDQGVLQRSSNNSKGSTEVPSIVHDVLNSSGQRLDERTRSDYESVFGRDLSGVQVHTDSQAAESARSVNALAYTVGRHIVFGAGQFAPASTGGRHLLAHELVHTLQQGQAGSSSSQNLTIGDPGTAAEREADHIAGEVTRNLFSGEPSTTLSRTIQRADSKDNISQSDTRGVGLADRFPQLGFGQSELSLDDELKKMLARLQLDPLNQSSLLSNVNLLPPTGSQGFTLDPVSNPNRKDSDKSNNVKVEQLPSGPGFKAKAKITPHDSSLSYIFSVGFDPNKDSNKDSKKDPEKDTNKWLKSVGAGIEWKNNGLVYSLTVDAKVPKKDSDKPENLLNFGLRGTW
jgi:hypothetical protein